MWKFRLRTVASLFIVTGSVPSFVRDRSLGRCSLWSFCCQTVLWWKQPGEEQQRFYIVTHSTFMLPTELFLLQSCLIQGLWSLLFDLHGIILCCIQCVCACVCVEEWGVSFTLFFFFSFVFKNWFAIRGSDLFSFSFGATHKVFRVYTLPCIQGSHLEVLGSAFIVQRIKAIWKASALPPLLSLQLLYDLLG